MQATLQHTIQVQLTPHISGQKRKAEVHKQLPELLLPGVSDRTRAAEPVSLQSMAKTPPKHPMPQAHQTSCK